jgi:hypothetical protein
MKNTEDLWGKFIEAKDTNTEVSASIQLLQSKEKKTLCSEEEFDKVFSTFFGNNR